jgi:ribosomal protein S18 acetylase RimI-like enzyme
MAASDTDLVQSLWSRRFGGNDSTQKNWIEAALDPDHSVLATIAAAPTARVAGFGMLDVAGPDYTRRYLSLDALDLDPNLSSQNGIFHMYCVSTDWEGRGIGSALYAHHIDALQECPAPQAFGLSWHRPHTVDSRVLFEKHGFTCLASVERYYQQFGNRPFCPDCDETCFCSASIYRRIL